MANDAALRSALVWLAAVIVVVGIWTFSFKKMMVTYIVGMFGIAGILLPDWIYFDRDFSLWATPVSSQERAPQISTTTTRFRFYPVRVIAYTTIYGFALYNWWMFVSS